MDATHLEVRIARKAVEARDIVTLELVAVGDTPLPPFSAGSHIDLEIRPGLVRQYSLCNDPDELHRYQLGILRDPVSRGGSVAVHEELQEGQVIRISPPRNHFPLVQAARYVLFAGGIGITPILCMAERLARIGADFSLHYCARSQDRAAFLHRLQGSGFAERVHCHYDDGEADQRLDLDAVLSAEPADSHLYVCGPGGFIDFVTGGARTRGWESSRIHLEYFSAKAVDTSEDGAFEVQLASTGQVFRIPEDETIVEVLMAEGVDISVSCQQGICGACITRVLDGEPDHRDQVLTDSEREEEHYFTPCCSRARSKRLVLDL